MVDTDISEATRQEVENILLMFLNDVRDYRDREHRRLKDPTLSTPEIFRVVGAVAALKSIEGKIDMLADLYKLEL